MFNLRDPAYRRSPYAVFAQLRSSSPVCRTEPHGFWAVLRHKDVVDVLKNSSLFSSSIKADSQDVGPQLLLSTRGLLELDRPSHTTYRKRLGRAFPADVLASLQPFITNAVRILLDDILHRQIFDFVKDFSAPLPIMVICKLLGLDHSRRDDIKRWSDTLLSWQAVAPSPEKDREVKAQMSDFYHYALAAITHKKQHPSDDIISSLLRTDHQDEELSLEDILRFIRLLVVAGTDTTTHLLGNTLLALKRDDKLALTIKNNPSLIPALIEESLRFDSPVICVMRRALADTEIANVAIKKDALILAFVASANHDDEVYKRADHFIIDRTPQHHLTFGTGIHFCMGSQIARLQTHIALRQIVPLLDQWQLANSDGLDYFNSIFFRGVTSLVLTRT